MIPVMLDNCSIKTLESSRGSGCVINLLDGNTCNSIYPGSGGGDFNLSTADIQNMATCYSTSPHNGWPTSGHPGGGPQGPLTAAVQASGLTHPGMQQ